MRECFINRNLIRLGFSTPKMYLRVTSPLIYKNLPIALFDYIPGNTIDTRMISRNIVKSVVFLMDDLKEKLALIDGNTKGALSRTFHLSFARLYNIRMKRYKKDLSVLDNSYFNMQRKRILLSTLDYLKRNANN